MPGGLPREVRTWVDRHGRQKRLPGAELKSELQREYGETVGGRNQTVGTKKEELLAKLQGHLQPSSPQSWRRGSRRRAWHGSAAP